VLLPDDAGIIHADALHGNQTSVEQLLRSAYYNLQFFLSDLLCTVTLLPKYRHHSGRRVA
jgi:hypothetical protein